MRVAQERRNTPLARSCAEPHSCPRPIRLQVLAHAPYFAGLPAEAIERIDARMQVRGYPEGSSIYRIGNPATHLFVLASGKVKLVRPSLDGTDVLVDVVTAGELFGSLATLGHSTYPDSAEALTVTCALSMSAAHFQAVLREYPQVALAVLGDIAHRLETAHAAVRRLSGGTVEQRVAASLLTLADKLGEPRGDTILLQMPLTRADLAAMTGTTTESVSRTLSRLRRKGIINTGRRWTSIIDREQLIALAHHS